MPKAQIPIPPGYDPRIPDGATALIDIPRDKAEDSEFLTKTVGLYLDARYGPKKPVSDITKRTLDREHQYMGQAPPTGLGDFVSHASPMPAVKPLPPTKPLGTPARPPTPPDERTLKEKLPEHLANIGKAAWGVMSPANYLQGPGGMGTQNDINPQAEDFQFPIQSVDQAIGTALPAVISGGLHASPALRGGLKGAVAGSAEAMFSPSSQRWGMPVPPAVAGAGVGAYIGGKMGHPVAGAVAGGLAPTIGAAARGFKRGAAGKPWLEPPNVQVMPDETKLDSTIINQGPEGLPEGAPPPQGPPIVPMQGMGLGAAAPPPPTMQPAIAGPAAPITPPASGMQGIGGPPPQGGLPPGGNAPQALPAPSVFQMPPAGTHAAEQIPPYQHKPYAPPPEDLVSADPKPSAPSQVSTVQPAPPAKPAGPVRPLQPPVRSQSEQSPSPSVPAPVPPVPSAPQQAAPPIQPTATPQAPPPVAPPQQAQTPSLASRAIAASKGPGPVAPVSFAQPGFKSAPQEPAPVAAQVQPGFNANTNKPGPVAPVQPPKPPEQSLAARAIAKAGEPTAPIEEEPVDPKLTQRNNILDFFKKRVNVTVPQLQTEFGIDGETARAAVADFRKRGLVDGNAGKYNYIRVRGEDLPDAPPLRNATANPGPVAPVKANNAPEGPTTPAKGIETKGLATLERAPETGSVSATRRTKIAQLQEEIAKAEDEGDEMTTKVLRSHLADEEKHAQIERSGTKTQKGILTQIDNVTSQIDRLEELGELGDTENQTLHSLYRQLSDLEQKRDHALKPDIEKYGPRIANMRELHGDLPHLNHAQISARGKAEFGVKSLTELSPEQLTKLRDMLKTERLEEESGKHL